MTALNHSNRLAQAHESSFIAESSFVRAPLNSRVVSGGIATSYGQPSNHRSAPREQQAAPSNYRGAPSATAQAGPSANVNGKGKAKQPSLNSAPLEIQEALILEDLLFVLMVRDLRASAAVEVEI
jgi:gamma-tubulin complex component 2